MAVLEGGRRTATYKLAVMVALLDLAVENAPEEPEAPVSIDLDILTHRVMEGYWRQLRPLDGHDLRQSNDGRGIVFDQITRLRDAVPSSRSREIPLDTAAHLAPDVYTDVRLRIKKNLVQQPLHRLQRVGKGSSDPFLYDDRWMHDKVSLRTIEAHGNSIELFPGVCHTLARLAPLVKPAFQLAWVDDVRRMNKNLLDDGPDLAHHLFGSDRISLTRPGNALADHFGNDCFYCGSRLRSGRHVDHVLPWSRVGIDGLTNLVLSCPGCNSSKSDILPATGLVTRALDRGRTTLDDLAESINWPSQFDRVASTANGLYLTQPPTTPVWLAAKSISPLGIVDIRWGDPR